jgi:hypothetical protein
LPSADQPVYILIGKLTQHIEYFFHFLWRPLLGSPVF